MASATWTNTQPGTQDWFAKANWSDDAVPTSADGVVIDDDPADFPDGYPPIGPTISEAGAAAATLTLEAGFLTLGYEFKGVESSGTLTVGKLIVDFDGVNGPQLNNSFGSTLTAGSVTSSGGVIYNYATMNVTGAIDLTGGGLDAGGGTLTAGSLTGAGNIDVQGGALNVGSVNLGGGYVQVTAGSIPAPGLDVKGAFDLGVTAQLIVESTSEQTAVSATVGSISNDGEIIVTGTASQQAALVTDGSGFGSPGVLQGNVQLQGDAVIQFPTGAGVAEIQGTLTLIGIADDGPGPQVQSLNFVTKAYQNALDDLTTIVAGGEIDLADDNAAIFASYDNKGTIYVDEGGYQLVQSGDNYYQVLPLSTQVGPPSTGGSAAMLGTVTNDGTIIVGNYLITTASAATITQLQNDASSNVAVIGSQDLANAQATLTLTNGGESDGNIHLQNYAVLNANGLTIGAKGHLYGVTGTGANAGQATFAVVNGSLDNNGIISADGETLTINGPVTGTGQAAVSNGTLVFKDAFDQAASVEGLGGQNGLLKLAQDDTGVITLAGAAVVDLEYAVYKSTYEALLYIGTVADPNSQDEGKNHDITATLQIVDPQAHNAVVATLDVTLGQYADALYFGSDNDGGILVSAETLPGIVNGAGDIVITDVQGQPYSTYEKLYTGGVFSGADYFFTGVKGDAYSSYVSDVSAGGDFIGTQFFYSPSAGATYSGEEVDYDGGGRLTRFVFSGVTGAPYSSYEYDYLGGLFAGSKFTFTSVPTGATYSSYETDYNYATQFTGTKFFYANVTGQSYTSEEEDFDASGKLSRLLLSGVTGQAYSSLEEDYKAGVYTGYKAYYTGISGQSYTGEEVDASAAGQLDKVVYTGMSGTPYSSVEQDYSGGSVADTIYDFTKVKGATYYSYQTEENAQGALIETTYDLNSGNHAIVGAQKGLTLTSLGDDVMTGGGSGETFVFNPIFGADTIKDFAAHESGPGHDAISLSTLDFANFAAVVNDAAASGTGGVNTTITSTTTHDALTLNGVTTAQLASLSADFAFHA